MSGVTWVCGDLKLGRQNGKEVVVNVSGGAMNEDSVPEGVIEEENLTVLCSLPDACVDLIYIDPPFGTGQVRRLDSIVTGAGNKTRIGFGGRTYKWEVRSRTSYPDRLSLQEHLDFLAPRVEEAHRVLKGTGSIYVHIDFRTVHYLRLMLDDVFGSDRFLNEIIWAYDFGGRARDKWPRKHDNILWYAKSSSWKFRPDQIERLPYMAPALVGPEKASRGKLPTDVWWMTIVPTNGRERTGYPTQKPEKLLERIITASSDPGDLVLDFFAGSGTTGAVAQRLGRRFLLVDNNPEAIRIARTRLQRAENMYQPTLLGKS